MANETKIVITAATAQAESALRSLEGTVGGITRSFFSLSGVAAGLTGALSITAFAGFIKSSIDAADRLNDVARITGTSVEALAGLKFAADQNGTSLEAVAHASKKLSVAMAENPDTLKKFGITAKDSTGALVQLADIFAAMPDGAEKTALAVKLLGKSGEEMIPFLNQGSEALRSMVEEGKRLNPITAEMAKQADQFNDQLNKLAANSKRAGISIANDLLPPLNAALESLLKFFKPGGGAEKVELKWLDDMVRSAGIKFKELEVMFESFAAKATFGDLSKRHQEAADLASKQLDRLRRDRATQAALADMSVLPDIAIPKTQDGRGKNLYDALNPDGKKKKTDPFKLENEAWVREKEFQIAQLNELVKAQEQADKEMQRSALEAQAVIFDIDPIAKASARWEELTALVDKGLLTQEQAAQSYNKTFGEIDKSGNDAFKSLENAVRGWGNQFTDEMTKMVRTGKLNFSSLADSIINDLIRIQIQKNITDKLVGWGTSVLDGLFKNADGGVYSGAGISAYSGSVVSSPTVFPFARGVGLMGEAGPEAILPLTRVNGKLGVQAQGGGKSGDTYYIDARGADSAAISRLESMIVSLNGSVERRALGAVNSALMSRGQRPVMA